MELTTHSNPRIACDVASRSSRGVVPPTVPFNTESAIMRSLRVSCGVLGLLLVAGGQRAGAQEITGSWRGQVEADHRVVGDARVIVRRDSIALSLSVEGDSLVGYWAQGSQRVPVHGRVEGRTLHLAAVAVPREMWLNGKRVHGPVQMRWTGAIVDGQLRGAFWTVPGDSVTPYNWEVRRQ